MSNSINQFTLVHDVRGLHLSGNVIAQNLFGELELKSRKTSKGILLVRRLAVGFHPPGDSEETVGSWCRRRLAAGSFRQATARKYVTFEPASAWRQKESRRAVVAKIRWFLRRLAPGGTCPPPGGLEAVAPSGTCPPLGDLVAVSPSCWTL